MAGDRLWITTLKFRKVEENSEIRRQVDNLINLATVLLEMILFCSKTRRMECDCFRHRTISDFRGPDLEGLRFILFFFFFFLSRRIGPVVNILLRAFSTTTITHARDCCEQLSAILVLAQFPSIFLLRMLDEKNEGNNSTQGSGYEIASPREPLRRRERRRCLVQPRLQVSESWFASRDGCVLCTEHAARKREGACAFPS